VARRRGGACGRRWRERAVRARLRSKNPGYRLSRPSGTVSPRCFLIGVAEGATQYARRSSASSGTWRASNAIAIHVVLAIAAAESDRIRRADLASPPSGSLAVGRAVSAGYLGKAEPDHRFAHGLSLRNPARARDAAIGLCFTTPVSNRDSYQQGLTRTPPSTLGGPTTRCLLRTGGLRRRTTLPPFCSYLLLPPAAEDR
jgi:hypothetical protein